MTRSLFNFTFATLALLLPLGLSASAQDKEAPAIKSVPTNIDDLKAMEERVHSVLEKVTPSTVGIQIGQASGSGVIVSEDGIVLTAGHVSGVPGSNAFVILSSGKKLKAKSLGVNGGVDCGMMKIEGGGPFPFVEQAKTKDLKPGTWCIAVGHPGGYRVNRGTVVRVGRILLNTTNVMVTDCALVGGDSGGPLFDMDGKLIAIHSRIGDKEITQNMHVPLDAFRKDWDRLVKGDNFGGLLGARQVIVPSAGGEVVLEKKEKITEQDPSDTKRSECHHRVYTFKMVPGFAYTIDMKSDALDSYLRLEDEDGKQLAENDDGGGKLDSRIVYRPSREQVYKIIATTCDPGQTGAFTLTVRQATIVVKDLPTGKVDVVTALRLPASRPQAVAGLFANAHLFDEDGKPMANAKATFNWKLGTKTITSDDQGQVRLLLSADNIEELTLEVPEGLHAMLRLTDGDGIPSNPKGGRKRPQP